MIPKLISIIFAMVTLNPRHPLYKNEQAAEALAVECNEAADMFEQDPVELLTCAFYESSLRPELTGDLGEVGCAVAALVRCSDDNYQSYRVTWKEGGAMEKIKRYEYGLDMEGEAEMFENAEGDFVKYEDHLAALREIFPDWPGEYPTETGHYYLICTTGVIEPRFVYMVDSIPFDIHGDPISEYSTADMWGPRCPMWRKV